MSDDAATTIDRRKFLAQSAALLAAGAALPSTALSYGRIVGANDRISLAHIGTGSRGGDLDLIAAQLKTSHNAEMTVVCDLWKHNREKAAATNTKYYGRAPRSFQYLEEVLALKDVDAVLISTPEHAHSPILKMAVEAGKDAYVEKPMGNVLAEVKAARDAVIEERPHRAGRHTASQRAVSQSRARFGADRRARRCQQSGNRLELSRAAMARARRNETDPRTGHGLAQMASDQALSAVRSRRSTASSACTRNFPAAFPISG